MLTKDTTTLHDFETAIENEWLETNGLGGWSSSTVIGCNTRRYHGLLVAATVPPVERMVLVSALEETIICGNEKFELGTNDYGQTISPSGHQYMTSFTRDLFPQFFYTVNNIELRKTIGMAYGENTTFIIYDVIKAPQLFTLELLPLVAARYYHSLVHANDGINTVASFTEDILNVSPYTGAPDIFIKVPGAVYHPEPNWFYNFNYALEQERGLDYTEDLFSHGKFTLDLKQGDSIGIVLSTVNPVAANAHNLLSAGGNRKKLLLKEQPAGELQQELALAADQFIVRRDMTASDTGQNLLRMGATVIAGYHWFTDWSRDTMISLPGLTLTTGRYEDAKKILLAFAGSVSRGMLPNRFQDKGGVPEYNTVDGTLWYFIAAYKYLQKTGDTNFVLTHLLPVLKEIIEWHYKGTRYNIHVDEDALLFAGEKGQQLTWMDAKVDDWVVTPRMGKPVEIQALWYNALKIYAGFLRLNNQPSEADIMLLNADKTKQSFDKLFWNTEGNYLYDNIDENAVADASLRPNQLFAISLPFALVEGEQAKRIITIVTEQLYTPVGLKSLSAKDSRYVGTYEGDRYKRDGAYHQGTVWSWLLGPYVDALMKVNAEDGRQAAKKVVENFQYHLDEACVGSVSEIFDGDAPHRPRGCIAQAWGVAELLRVISEYDLGGL